MKKNIIHSLVIVSLMGPAATAVAQTKTATKTESNPFLSRISGESIAVRAIALGAGGVAFLVQSELSKYVYDKSLSGSVIGDRAMLKDMQSRIQAYNHSRDFMELAQQNPDGIKNRTLVYNSHYSKASLRGSEAVKAAREERRKLFRSIIQRDDFDFSRGMSSAMKEVSPLHNVNRSQPAETPYKIQQDFIKDHQARVNGMFKNHRKLIAIKSGGYALGLVGLASIGVFFVYDSPVKAIELSKHDEEKIAQHITDAIDGLSDDETDSMVDIISTQIQYADNNLETP